MAKELGSKQPSWRSPSPRLKDGGGVIIAKHDEREGKNAGREGVGKEN